MSSQAEHSSDPVGKTVAWLEMALQERLREIDILRLEVDRYRRQSEEAHGRAAMVQAAFDRHLEHCSRDDAAIQRLMAALAEATARRKEQFLIIERRNERIADLQREMASLKRWRMLGNLNPFSMARRMALAFSGAPRKEI